MKRNVAGRPRIGERLRLGCGRFCKRKTQAECGRLLELVSLDTALRGKQKANIDLAAMMKLTMVQTESVATDKGTAAGVLGGLRPAPFSRHGLPWSPIPPRLDTGAAPRESPIGIAGRACAFLPCSCRTMISSQGSSGRPYRGRRAIDCRIGDRA